MASAWAEAGSRPRASLTTVARKSYGHHSSQVCGFAYRALRRRMAAIGIELSPPEEPMPGPVDFGSLAEWPVLGAVAH